MTKNFSDLVFRLLFSLIFIGLGGEHMLNDELLLKIMPSWMHLPRFVSIFCGLFLFLGGSMIAVGFRLKWAAIMLGTFLIIVTALVHAPGISAAETPVMHVGDIWMWETLQRSNFVKNICLLGVCIMLPYYQLGDWALDSFLKRRVRA